ncbi:uncharacterized protein [Triticum aestivum]|uniref:uncharacterized protein isoform X2 n=1 Tax=Triticum aestivum TaxID=4565 RepID=UPI001D0022F6|nr:uncharacterized protein LOC123070484 isoform X2 [Triticum aestivum]
MGWVGAPDPAPSSFFLTGSPPYYLPIDATFISPAARRPTRHRPAPVAQRPPRHRPAPAARPLHLARSTHSQDTRRGHAVQMQRGCRRPPVEKSCWPSPRTCCSTVSQRRRGRRSHRPAPWCLTPWDATTALLALRLASAAGPCSCISRGETRDRYGYPWADSTIVIQVRDIDDRPLPFLVYPCGCSAAAGDGGFASAAEAARRRCPRSGAFSYGSCRRMLFDSVYPGFYRCRKSLCESVRAPVVQVGRMEDFVNLNRYIFHGMSFHFFI